jgi:hypothetical protein
MSQKQKKLLYGWNPYCAFANGGSNIFRSGGTVSYFLPSTIYQHPQHYYFFYPTRPVYVSPMTQTQLVYARENHKTGGLDSNEKSGKSEKNKKKNDSKSKSKNKNKKQTFAIHDNCGRPFEVTLSVTKKTKTAMIACPINCKYIPTFQVTYTRAWIGFGSDYQKEMEGKDRGEWSRGNNILLENPDNFKLLSADSKDTTWPVSSKVVKKTMSVLWIGYSIGLIELPPGETIVKFVSKVGNNDVPYPYFFTQNYTYLVAEDVIMSNSEIPRHILENPHYDENGDWQDVYRWYYKMEYTPAKNPKIVSRYDWVQVSPGF